MLPKTSMTFKTKTRQTSKQPISTKQIVAPFVHTKSTIPLNIHVEKIKYRSEFQKQRGAYLDSLGCNCSFRFLCSFLRQIFLQCLLLQKEPPQICSQSSNACSAPKKNPQISFPFLTYIYYSFPKT